MTELQKQQHRRISDKVRGVWVHNDCEALTGSVRRSNQVWGQVEKVMDDMRNTLGKRLRDTSRGLEEIERTIE